MRVRLLGTAAGGGFPQWNCGCRNCRGVRAGTLRASPRMQSCVAVSADGRRWFLVNASPDVRAQVESFPPLTAFPGPRGTGIAGVLLTNADLDHTLGLMVLREGAPLVVHAPPVVRASVVEHAGIARTLAHYCGIEWRDPPTGLSDLRDRDGAPSGLRYAAFPVAGQPPRYARSALPGATATTGHAVAYRFVDPATGGRAVCVPGLAAVDDDAVRAELADCDLLLLDGTFWADDEMARAGGGTATAADMGHLPVGGPNGTLARVAAGRPAGRTVYLHMNNTNPILVDDSHERRTVEAAGAIVGADGMEFTL